MSLPDRRPDSLSVDPFVMMQQHQARFLEAIAIPKNCPSEFGMTPHMIHFLVG
jgi:hypothetical protein